MFIDLHCNSTQTQQRFRGRESTQIQCHERVLYANAGLPAALQGHNFFREGTNTAMFIDLHCNSTQTQQRFRGCESTQIQWNERVLYASARRPVALQGHKFFREGTVTDFWLATLATPPYLGVRKSERFCFTMTKTMFGQDEAWTNVELHVCLCLPKSRTARRPPLSHAGGLAGLPTGRGKYESILLIHDNDKVWPRRGMNKCWTTCLACACPSQEQQDFPLFPTKSRSKFIKKIRIYQKKLMKTAQIDENRADLGGEACWGMAGVAWVCPRQSPSHAQPYPVQFCRKRGEFFRKSDLEVEFFRDFLQCILGHKKNISHKKIGIFRRGMD